MHTVRHDYNLIQGGNLSRLVSAPRYFVVDRKIYYVHVSKDCEYVNVYLNRRFITEKFVDVGHSNVLKLYSNKKGFYFNFSYWVSEDTKKTIRVYLCE